MPDQRLLADRILDALHNAESPLKAREIVESLGSDFGFWVTRKEVNALLYGAISDRVARDDEYRWRPVRHTEPVDSAPSTPAQTSSSLATESSVAEALGLDRIASDVSAQTTISVGEAQEDRGAKTSDTFPGTAFSDTRGDRNSARDLRSHVSSHPLSPAASIEEFLLHQAALEWSLADSIIIERAEDIKSRINWQERLEPYHHQVQNLMTFCRRLPVTLLADDVGLGKTISAGLVLSELMIRRRVSRALVICPSILGPQWIEELESKFGIIGRWATGRRLDDEFRRKAPVVATTYESASPRLQNIAPGAFDMLILDEAHKLRNLYGTQKPPRLAQRIHKTLDQRLFKYVLMLTATPIQNRLWDLYTLVDCLAVAKGHANPFGAHGQFKRDFIADPTTARNLKPNKADEFRRILRQYLVRTRRSEVRLLFPQREVKLFRVEPNEVDHQLQQIVAGHIRGLSGFQQVSLARALMSSPQALVAQLKNMAGKNPQWRVVADEVEGIVNRNSAPSKILGLLQVIQQLQGQRAEDWRLVIFTIRRETLRIIGEALKASDIPFGVIQGGAGRKNTATVKSFSAKPPEIHVIVSTDAGAEGINLQAGNVLVNFDLPWNPMVVEQRIGRIQRLASDHRHVLIINLAVADSPEEKVVARLMQKLQTISDTVGDIEAVLEASGGDADAGESSFEAQIRDMVLKSLAGQDVEKGAQLAEQNIQQARDLFEKHRKEMDVTLGDLNELHLSGPTMPRLTPVTPEVQAEDFVVRALREEGFALSRDRQGLFRAERRGEPVEFVTFDERHWEENRQTGVFMGRSPKLYVPGKPLFERLVQRWLDRGAHMVSDTRRETEEYVRRIAERWLSKIRGSSLSDVVANRRQSVFRGCVRFKATASNSLDSYEKLVDLHHVPQGHHQIDANALDSAALVAEEIEPQTLTPMIDTLVQQAVAADGDVTAFCEFYGARLKEELDKAGDDEAGLKKVERDLLPSIHAHIVSMKGVLYETCHIEVGFAILGHDGYSVELEVCPLTGQVFQEPKDWTTCNETEIRAPAQCLDVCQISSAIVLNHLLVASDETGRKALACHTAVCGVSGKTVLKDEFTESDVTGRHAVASEFRLSPVNGRKGLPDEFVRCDFTGEKVLVDEVAVSKVSGETYRKDQELACVISGKKGHRNEFVTCSVTGDTIIPTESEKSPLSGRVVRRDRIQASDKPPHRRAASDEFVTCRISGTQLLRDEVARCAVSEKLVDKDLLLPSERSGQMAIPTELVRCQETGCLLLPSEIGTCCASGRVVDSRLLGQSEISGAWALPDRMVQCPGSGKRGLPEEFERCQLTGEMVAPTILESCTVTGKRARRDRLIQCAVSGKYILPSAAVRSLLDKQAMCPDEAVYCYWNEGFVLPRQSATCDRTGLTFARNLIGPTGEFVVLSMLLNGEVKMSDASDLIPWLRRQAGGELKAVKRARYVASPSGGTRAICAAISPLFSLRVRYAGLLVAMKGGPKVLGRITCNSKNGRGWVTL